ncbi:MAG: class I SAM-dependent methyltransferase [Chitinophagaceae bacterium]|nr:class I SAM-dependent methyltransferase [Chitinophagaceae bacterium]
MPEPLNHPASYRDPSGFVFQVDGIYYRQVHRSYAENYETLMSSGLYDTLIKNKWLIEHREVPENLTASADWYKTLLPTQIHIFTYPYEWCFGQLQDAALLTLKILIQSVGRDMILKDASPFNIQFQQGAPLFIDTLSFEKYDASLPWVAYRQFCECFLFPLYLEHYCGVDTGKILTAYPDGIPADVTSRLLPRKSRLNPGALMHVHLQTMIKPGPRMGKPPAFSRQKLMYLIQHLERIVKKLKPGPASRSVWSNYYEDTILSRQYLDEKQRLFRDLINGLHFLTAIDLGANDGFFSQILAERTEASITAIDADVACINRLYNTIRKKNIPNILPLHIDVLHPSPAIGFRNKERTSFNDRFRAELVIALALIHHLVLGANIPLDALPPYFAILSTDWLIIEFVPLEDEKAQELIRNKDRWHIPYDVPSFERYFGECFSIERKSKIPGTERILYLMKKQPVK